MPSRNTNTSGPSLPSLSEIIQLEPEKEPWCAGFAPSKGRRCHNPTNKQGRRAAIQLLHEGTADLRAGRNIDELLEDLAPHVLCTRWHQNQASDLVRRWKRQVDLFLRSRATSASTRESTRSQSGRVRSRATGENVEAECADLRRKLRDLTAELRRLQALQAARNEATETPNDSLRRGREQTGTDSNPTIAGRGDTPTNPVERTMEAQPTAPADQSATDAPSQVQVQGTGHEGPVLASDHGPTAAPTVAIISNDAGNQNDHEEVVQTHSQTTDAPSVTRRTVEGECGICLCHLQTTRPDSNTRVEADEEEQTERDDEGSVEQELDWCRARCGVNFHKVCIDQWLRTANAPTCPTCRNTWRS